MDEISFSVITYMKYNEYQMRINKYLFALNNDSFILENKVCLKLTNLYISFDTKIYSI